MTHPIWREFPAIDDWRANTVTSALSSPRAPVLMATNEATYHIPRMFGHAVPDVTFVRVGKDPFSARSLLTDARAIGFMGDACFHELLTLVETRRAVAEAGRELIHLGVSDAFAARLGFVDLPEDVILAPETKEEHDATKRLLELEPWLCDQLGPKTCAVIRSGNYVVDFLPWAHRNDRIDDYVRAMSQPLGF